MIPKWIDNTNLKWRYQIELMLPNWMVKSHQSDWIDAAYVVNFLLLHPQKYSWLLKASYTVSLISCIKKMFIYEKSLNKLNNKEYTKSKVCKTLNQSTAQ